MGSRLSHTVGLVNNNSNLYILGWSKIVGDLGIAHFIGMHPWQVLPVLVYYVIKDLKLTIIILIFYGLLAVFTLVQALQGRSFFR